ncbi:MAG: oxidoreductase [Rhodobacterales bacterium]|nr:MAG: oxidoreductase [Rhodobacterales bacterium]
MSFSLSGKTAIVTGAANGIGLAIGRHFAESGANVIFADMDEANLQKELGEKLADEGPVRAFAGDLRQKLTIANLLSTTIAAFDRVDILVNATRQITLSDPLDPDGDAVMPMIEQNLLTPLRVSQAVAKRMIRQVEDDEDAPAGTIINISSIAARRAHPDLLGFSVATAGLEQMTRSLAVALAQHRVRVNAVAIGSVMSASLKGMLRDNPDLRERVIDVTPLNRIAPASELIGAVQYLASDASAFVTGEVMTVDGGRSLIDPVTMTAAH